HGNFFFVQGLGLLAAWAKHVCPQGYASPLQMQAARYNSLSYTGRSHDFQEVCMTDLKMPGAMAELRPGLAEIVSQGQKSAPYFTALLSSKSGLNILVDNREEQVSELPPSAGTVLSAFDGATIHERAIGGFGRDEVARAARELVQG